MIIPGYGIRVLCLKDTALLRNSFSQFVRHVCCRPVPDDIYFPLTSLICLLKYEPSCYVDELISMFFMTPSGNPERELKDFRLASDLRIFHFSVLIGYGFAPRQYVIIVNVILLVFFRSRCSLMFYGSDLRFLDLCPKFV